MSMELPEKSPKVSVCVITYNQEKYIRQCLQSIVNQVTDFSFEVIVGDDCSTDGTRDIVREFAERHQGVVKPIYQEKNIAAGVHNFLTVHAAARGEYIAHIDGDDYALPGKLKAQADFLDKNLECNIVWHRMGRLSKNSNNVKLIRSAAFINALFFSKRDMLALGSVGHHSSKMYRAWLRKECCDLIKHGFDYEFDIAHVGKGRAALLNRVLGVYRPGIGISSNENMHTRLLLDEVLRDNYSRDKQNRGRISSIFLLRAIVDIKKRKFSSKSLKNYFEHFTILSFYYFIIYTPVRVLLRLWQR